MLSHTALAIRRWENNLANTIWKITFDPIEAERSAKCSWNTSSGFASSILKNYIIKTIFLKGMAECFNIMLHEKVGTPTGGLKISN